MSLFASALNSAIHPATENPGDFRGEDGLLYCGVCKQRKEMRLELMPGTEPRIVPVICACDEARIQAENRLKAAEKAREKIRRLRKECLSDPLYEAYSFDHDDCRDVRASDIAKRYVERFDDFMKNNVGLMFYGEVGAGKSFLAGCIANALIDKGVAAMMSTVQGLVAEAGKNYGEVRDDVLHQVRTAQLLILDDFGVERDTEYMTEQTYEIINTRYKAKLPLIVTTNLSPAMMERETNITKRRVYERVLEMCQTVRVNGESRRKGISQEKAKLARELLGLEGST